MRRIDMSQLAPSPIKSGYPASEICTLIVNGQKFTDWETVWVESRWTDSFSFFRFTAAERDPMPPNWTLLQFKPGDAVTVELGGQVALSGFITDRASSYDAFNHTVQLVGKSKTYWGYKSSVDTPTGSFDGMSFEQVARQVLAPYPGNIIVIGVLNPLPFVHLQNEIGELTWNFLERIARPRGIVLGADAMGNYLLIGDHTYPVASELIEGVNIKACQCLISHDQLMQEFDLRGQTAGTDQSYSSAANEMRCVVKGSAELYSKLITPSEQPLSSQAELCQRAWNEARWHEGTIVNATVVVYGWLRGGTALWKPGDDVYVQSRMAMLNQTLKIRTVTFEQNDNTGTQTTLDLTVPWNLNDNGAFDLGKLGVPQAPVPNPQGAAPKQGTVTIEPPVVTGGE